MYPLAPIQACHKAGQSQFVIRNRRVGGNWQVATCPQTTHKYALGAGCCLGSVIVERAEQFSQLRLIAHFQAQRPLTGSREYLLKREIGHASCEIGGNAQAQKASHRQDDRVIFSRLQLTQARIHVATQWEKLGLRKKCANLSGAAQATCADALRWSRVERTGMATDQNVASILARARHQQAQARRLNGWQILQAMDCNIDTLLSKGALDLHHKNTISADLCQRYMGYSIARCANLFNNYLQAGPASLELGYNPARLPHRQLAGSRPDD